MNIQMWPDDSPPDLSSEVARLEVLAAGFELQCLEARQVAQYFYRDAIAHGALESDAQWLEQHPWLEEE
jgi:hypothetical protein